MNNHWFWEGGFDLYPMSGDIFDPPRIAPYWGIGYRGQITRSFYWGLGVNGHLRLGNLEILEAAAISVFSGPSLNPRAVITYGNYKANLSIGAAYEMSRLKLEDEPFWFSRPALSLSGLISFSHWLALVVDNAMLITPKSEDLFYNEEGEYTKYINLNVRFSTALRYMGYRWSIDLGIQPQGSIYHVKFQESFGGNTSIYEFGDGKIIWNEEIFPFLTFTYKFGGR